MEIILLTKGYLAKVDDEDYDRINQYKWCVFGEDHHPYAERRIKTEKGSHLQLMHRLVVNAPKGMVVDHINHNGLDNRKENLRICTDRENRLNSRKYNYKNSYSKYRGVTWDKKRNKWVAQIMCNRKNYNLGVFDTQIEAAMAYDVKAVELHGQYAGLNFSQRTKPQHGCWRDTKTRTMF